jgi:cytochrome c-type biogenesis protein CcmE
VGAFRTDGGFEAKQVLAKHDERYMPREVAKALKEQGEWRGDGATPAYQKTSAR